MTFNYVSKLSFNEPSCCIRFVETASQNMVSERFVLLSFFDIDDFKYTFILPYTTVSRVIFNFSKVIFNNYMKLLHYINREVFLDI